MAALTFDLNSVMDYQRFLDVKSLPVYSVRGRMAWIPDEYADRIGAYADRLPPSHYTPILGLFDYQRDIASLAIRKRKFACFLDCGLGKTLILTEFARHAAAQFDGRKSVLIVSPLMVVDQTLSEIDAFYGRTLEVDRVAARDLAAWTQSPDARIGITNYDALNETVEQGRLGAMILDESSMLKSHYGKWAQHCIRLGKGLEWKLCLTGTPAPNDRIEYANHAVFLDQFPTVNSFLAKFFINRGETQDRWALKPHALGPFYRALSHWSLFMTSPAAYGWKDNSKDLPPIEVHIHDVDLTADQNAAIRAETGKLFACEPGGIAGRSALARIAKGRNGITTNKPAYMRELVNSWPSESTIIWCKYNDEQDALARVFPDAANISGDTPHEDRVRLIKEFKSGQRKTLISKPKILGFGLNLQIATRQIFSTLQDSYEEYYQAVKRSNRYGSTLPLNVHIPVTDAERPMVETVLRKARMVQADTEEQERIFMEHGYASIAK